MVAKIGRLFGNGVGHNAAHLVGAVLFGSIFTLIGFLLECVPLWVALNVVLDVPWSDGGIMALKIGAVLLLFRIPFRVVKLALKRS